MIDGRRRFGPLSKDVMTPAQREVADAIRSGPRGPSADFDGPLEALLHSPDFAMPAQQLGAYLRYESEIPHRLRELVVILTARRWSSRFQWQVHRNAAERAGLQQGVIESIARGQTPALDDDGRAVFEFATALLGSGAVNDEQWAAVESRWGKRGALDLIGTVGYYSMIAHVVNVDRFEPHAN